MAMDKRRMVVRFAAWASLVLALGTGSFAQQSASQTGGQQTGGQQTGGQQTGGQPTGAQQTGAQPTGAQPTEAQPAGAQQQVTPGVAVNAAQKPPNVPVAPTTENNPGVEAGGYEIKQSFEFGGRIANIGGNRGVWDTYVNLDSGPRLLEYSLDMHSASHTGLLFDDLTFNSFGYGGDPNDVSRLMMSKGKIYTFNADFRRDQNIFDYNLLANPLNPPTSNPNVPILQSPHEFLMTRRMSDVNLHLLPTSKVQFRASYSRVTNQGTTFSSFHQGTEALLQQPTSYISDNYSGGISIRLIPRTSINYDQFYTYFKGDTTADLAPAGTAAIFGVPTFTLSNGNTVSLGFPFNTVAGYPCAAPVLASGLANPSCNGFTSYTRFGRVRNSYPTEQLSIQSSYWHRVDLSARAIYSDADSSMPDFSSLFAGLESRTRAVVQNLVAPPGSGAASHRLSLTTDAAATFHVTDKFNIVDQFRYTNFRIPGTWMYTETTLFAPTMTTAPNQFSPATCPTVTSAGCPQHSSSSGADFVTDSLTDFLRQSETVNTFELEYSFTKRVHAYLGYRFERRNITDNNSDNQVSVFFPTLPNRGACAGQPLVNNVCTVATVLEAENDSVQINANSALIGFAARPTDKIRINADTEFFTADNFFTRISPRHLQLYRVKGSYRPKDWVDLGAAVYIRENRNTSLDIGNLQHNRSYSFNSTFMPADSHWGLDLSYDYNDIFSQTNICYVSTPTPPAALSCGTPFLQGLSTYTELSHFVSGTIFLKPVRRVTAHLGYTVTSSTGNTLILNPIAPTGPLSYNYHLPLVELAVELHKHLIFKGGWNNYDYNEKSEPGPTLPRDFHGNVFTLSMRYVM